MDEYNEIVAKMLELRAKNILTDSDRDELIEMAVSVILAHTKPDARPEDVEAMLLEVRRFLHAEFGGQATLH